MDEVRKEGMVTHEAREPLHKFLKFDIKEHERSRPGDFWESEEGLEIGIVRTRESMQFSLEYIIGCLQDLSEEIFKSVKETDTLKNVSIGARISLTRAMSKWLEGVAKEAAGLEKDFQMLEKIKTDYFKEKPSPFWSGEAPAKKINRV